MTESQLRSTLYLAGAFCVIGAVASVTLAIVTPVIEEDASMNIQPTRIRPNDRHESHRLRVGDFYALSQKAIQGPFEEMEPVKPPKKAEQVPVKPVKASIVLNATLVGTLVDQQPELARAWIQFQGRQHLVRVGDTLKGHPGDPYVEAIADQSVSIRLSGATIELSPPPNALTRDQLLNADDK
ncbi:hypothetical protein Enr13x_24120 [Stieleria neptunia]|uniref:Type II secretion system protein GspC N-terminal domain-containing protein n=1 Tax=Stieleria neptunia TaxID=2527979 RepID=A0A518HNZ0_9BACT|nr:type II secretion system protein N [Stieleria neptunia]QDV42564.1 hypothetical protein Enr13x_24120 [Stieleria neptunia]